MTDDQAMSFVQRQCVLENAGRDPVDSLKGAETLCAERELRPGAVLSAAIAAGRLGWGRRVMSCRTLVGLALAAQAGTAFSGAQQYEPLATGVQAALHAAVADIGPPEPRFASPDARARWLAGMSSRLARRLSDEAKRHGFLLSVHCEAQRAGLDPQLVLALIKVAVQCHYIE